MKAPPFPHCPYALEILEEFLGYAGDEIGRLAKAECPSMAKAFAASDALRDVAKAYLHKMGQFEINRLKIECNNTRPNIGDMDNFDHQYAQHMDCRNKIEEIQQYLFEFGE